MNGYKGRNDRSGNRYGACPADDDTILLFFARFSRYQDPRSKCVHDTTRRYSAFNNSNNIYNYIATIFNNCSQPAQFICTVHVNIITFRASVVCTYLILLDAIFGDPIPAPCVDFCSAAMSERHSDHSSDVRKSTRY